LQNFSEIPNDKIHDWKNGAFCYVLTNNRLMHVISGLLYEYELSNALKENNIQAL